MTLWVLISDDTGSNNTGAAGSLGVDKVLRAQCDRVLYQESCFTLWVRSSRLKLPSADSSHMIDSEDKLSLGMLLGA